MEKMQAIEKCVWEIPASGSMRAAIRVYANERILPTIEEQTIQQARNVASLPGIVGKMHLFSDAHVGYGMPVGGTAAFDAKEGIISPGVVGYDINCLTADTKILLEYGCHVRIKELEQAISERKISFVDLETHQKKSAPGFRFFKKKPGCQVLKITTASGEEITLTEDHPLYNGKSMIKAGKLKENDFLVIHPFDGPKYEKPSEDIVVNEGDILQVAKDRWKLVQTLKEKGLVPLRMNSPALPKLAKLLGFLTGDGWLGKRFSRKRNQDVWAMRAIGTLEDLDEIKQEINSLGYDIGYIKTKQYDSSIEQIDGKVRKISGNSSQLYINSQSLAVLMKALGMPEGNKSKVAVKVPDWIKTAPKWVKRLYLAGLFGAELTIPYQRKGEAFGFTEPSFSQNKIEGLREENKQFLKEIDSLLGEFGVKTNKIYEQKGVINREGQKTIKHSLKISANSENLIQLWSQIGYEYCKERKQKSMLAVAYLKAKQRTLNKSREFVNQARILLSQGTKPHQIYSFARTQQISETMVKGQLYSRNKSFRATRDFPIFEKFCAEHKIEDSEMVLDKIEKIEKMDYADYVYDFTMDEENHNFIANHIVSHNCGMRLLTTNLTSKEAKPKIKELMELLFKKVPVGVGRKGMRELKPKEFEEVMVKGAKWCVQNGYGWKEDLERMEEKGCVKGAKPEKVSKAARERGTHQLGTLGSGNHYLEVQLSTAKNIFDSKTAKVFGITGKDQIVAMIHCGSRGFGHQVCTDFGKTFQEVMPKYGIAVPDRDLACAPFQSEEGQDYYAAMACAANNAFANRQMIMYQVRESFEQVFKRSAEEMEMHLTYDVAHNIAKLEKHWVEGKKREVVVHRKGSTRAFGPGEKDLSERYQKTGQPVIVGGSMETGSYLCVGTEKAMRETFGSTLHGSGRTMSRQKAKQEFRGEKLQAEMLQRGIFVKAASMEGLAEEAGKAYKNINDVIESMHVAGISLKVAALQPIGNIKG